MESEREKRNWLGRRPFYRKSETLEKAGRGDVCVVVGRGGGAVPPRDVGVCCLLIGGVASRSARVRAP